MSVDGSGRRAAQALLEAARRLGPPPDLDRLRRRRRRRAAGRAALATAAAVLAMAVAWQSLPLLDRPAPGRPAAWPGVPGLDRHVRDAVPTGRAADTGLAVAQDAVWVLNRYSGQQADELVRVDPASDRIVARVPVGRASQWAAAGDGSVWVLRSSPDLTDLIQVDPASNRVVRTLELPAAADTVGVVALTDQLVVTGDGAWFIGGDGLVRVDLRSGRARTVLSGSRYSPLSGLAGAGDSIWVLAAGSVLRLRPADGAVMGRADLGDQGPVLLEGLAGAAGALWVVGEGRAVRVDPATGRAVASVELVPGGALAGGGTVAGAGDGDTVAIQTLDGLHLIDPATNRVRARIPLRSGGAVAAGAGAVWVTDEAGGRLLRIELEP